MLSCFCYREMKGNSTLLHGFPLNFLLRFYTHGKQQGRTIDFFKNEGVSKDAFKYHSTELQDLRVRYLSSVHIRVPSSACGPHACTCYPHPQQDKTFRNSNMPHSSSASATITKTHLHLYFPPFVSNQMHTGNDWSDMNLIRG